MKTNYERMQKLSLYVERVRELFEQKYTKEDWEIGLPATKAYYNKCREIASTEIFG